MKLGELGSVVADLRARLVHFTTHDVRRRPILGLYFVIGAMVASYVVYLVIVIAKDVGNAGKEKVPVTTATEQGQQAPGPAIAHRCRRNRGAFWKVPQICPGTALWPKAELGIGSQSRSDGRQTGTGS